MGLFEEGSTTRSASDRVYESKADARITESIWVNVPLGQREPTEGSLVRRAGHGESPIAGAVCCAAAAERLPYRQVRSGHKCLPLVRLR